MGCYVDQIKCPFFDVISQKMKRYVNVLRASMVLDIRDNCASSRFEIGDPNTSLNETIRATLAAALLPGFCQHDQRVHPGPLKPASCCACYC